SSREQSAPSGDRNGAVLSKIQPSPCSSPMHVSVGLRNRLSYPVLLAMKLSQLASSLECRLEGDGDIEISGVRGVEHASHGHLTFLANPKYAPRLKNTRASAVIAGQVVPGLPTLVSPNPYHDFARALEFFYQPPRPRPG